MRWRPPSSVRGAASLPSSGTRASRPTSARRPNEVVVHGIPSKYRLRPGDILSIDACAIYEGYHGDAALTFGIGDIDEDAARLLDVTRRALWAGIDQVRVGKRVGDLGHAVEQTAAPHGYGVVRDYVGHGIGRAMHEPPQIPNYGVPGRGLRLRRGMAVCIEPMFNLGTEETRTREDGWTVVTGRRHALCPLRAHCCAHRRRAGGDNRQRLANRPGRWVRIACRPPVGAFACPPP